MKSFENEPSNKKRLKPAITPEARENQLISLAIDQAEKQLLNGTASSQVITHYLKLGSTKERVELEILSKQKDLIVEKTESLKSARRVDEMYEKALNAFRKYNGQPTNEEELDDY